MTARELVNHRRFDLCKTGADMAAAVGISRTLYSKYENGHRRVPSRIADEVKKLVREAKQ